MKTVDDMTPEEIKMIQHAIEFAKFVSRQGYSLITDDAYMNGWIKKGTKTAATSREVYEQFLNDEQDLSDIDRYKKRILSVLRMKSDWYAGVRGDISDGVLVAIDIIENLPAE